VLDIETFARRAERVYSRATLERKVKVLRMYDEFLERSGLEPGPESLATWLDSLDVKPQSLSVYARDVLSYFNIMMLDVDERKVRQVKSMIPPITFKQPEILTVDEVRRLLEVSNYPHKVAFALAYAYARRLSEVLSCEVDLKSGTVTFPIVKRRGGERVEFKLEDWIKDMIFECVNAGKCGGKRLFKITGRAVEIAFKKALARAGIKPNDRRLRVHSLRHCLHPNTRIVVPEGVLPASMMYFRHSPVMAFDFDNFRIVEAEVSGKSMHITDKLVSIWAGGRELICTPEHRVFRLRNGVIEEVEAGKLRVGDYIAGVRWIDVPNKRRIFDPRLWRLLGYITGDGYVHETSTSRAIEISEKDEEIASYYSKLAKDLGFRVSIKQERDSASYRITIGSVALVELAKSLSIGVRSPSRRVPLELFHATDEEIREFIAGFYDAEGLSVEDDKSFPRMFSTSKELLKDIQILLLYFGIHSYLMKRIRNVRLPQGKEVKDHVIYELAITDRDDIERFSKLIPTLKPIVVKPKTKKKSGDIIPVSDVLRRIYERRVREGKPLAKKDGNEVVSLSKYLYVNPSRKALEKLLNKLIYDEPESAFLRRLVEGNIRWLKVTRIEKSGGYGKYARVKEVHSVKQLVYDFEVQGYQTLITDGIISHNSRLTHLVEMGVPLEVVSKTLAYHANISTTYQFYVAPTKVMQSKVIPAGEILWRRS
jgi:intein/homing endonuclease/integrase